MIATSHRSTLRALSTSLAFLLLAACQAMAPGAHSPTDTSTKNRGPTPAAKESITPSSDQEKDAAGVAGAKTTRDVDLWQTIRNDFSLNHEIEHPRVQAEIAQLVRYPTHLEQMAENLQLYLPLVHERVHRRRMPGEIALLPIIESGMNPQADSLSGASGLWQFIPATGDRLGLPRNWWFDGRRDPALSTQAALDYLQYLFSQFHDWRLAIVSYNSGEGTVRRALDGRTAPVSFWELRLPASGMSFVPKLLALSEIIANPERYGIVLPKLRGGPTFTVLRTGGQVSVPRVAEAIGLDPEALFLLNPALNRSSTPPDGPHHLNVPPASAELARQWFASLDHSKQPQWDSVVIRPGDSLSVLAQRHGTDVATLRRINNLSNDRLRAGDSLLIPDAGSRASAPSRRAATSRAAEANAAVHIVRAGDSLWTIARRYRVTVAALAQQNGIRQTAVLRIGQRLTISGDSSR